MFSLEKEIIKEATNEIEAIMYEEDFITDIEDIMEDAILGLDNDDIQIEEADININESDISLDDINQGLIF